MLKNYGLTDDRVRIENDDDHILTTPQLVLPQIGLY